MPLENTQPDYSYLFSHYFPHIAGAFGGTTLSHPFRVLLNRAPYHTNPIKVFADFPAYWRTGFGLNLARGVTAVSLQSWSKTQVHQYYGHHTLTGKVAGWFAASSMGALIATFIETPFIRKTTFEAWQRLSYMRFSLPLSKFFFVRESCFSAVVLSEKDLPKNVYYPLFVAATWISGMCHKFATWDATADILGYKFNTPNFKRDGVWQTFNNIAKGNVYNHPSCAVPIVNPVTTMQLLRNFSHVAFHPNMFLFRFILFVVYKNGYHFGIEAAPKIKNESAHLAQSLFRRQTTVVEIAEPLNQPRKG